MKNVKPYSDYYFVFHSLDSHGRVRYYVEEVEQNYEIDYYEKLELNIECLKALFDIGKYEKYLYLVDAVIEKVIEENIGTLSGVDVFANLLFKKAACHYNLKEYSEAIVILKQLVKIDSKESLYKLLLSKSMRKLQQVNKSGPFRPITMILFLMAITIKIADIFFVEPFYFQYHPYVSYTAIVLSLSGLGILIYDSIVYLYQKYFT